MKKVIIIADSLTNDFSSPEERYQSNSVNIWRRVISRVFWDEKNYWNWPLPTYLRSANLAKKTWKDINTILLQDLHDPNNISEQQELLRYWKHNMIWTEWAQFVKPIQSIVSDSHILNSDTLSIPISEFHKIMSWILQKDILALSKEQRDEIIFIVCWFYTNLRIKSTSEKLRHDYRFNNVLVSPHLTWSRDYMLHMNTLQVDLPNSLIKIVSDLWDIWKLSWLDSNQPWLDLGWSIRILPEDISNQMSIHQTDIIKTLFLLNEEVNLKLLNWWFSWSMLFLAQWRIAWANTEWVVVKIDKNMQMFKEISWYNQVKDYLGKNVPTFAVPISSWELTWVKMELASMQWTPTTVQKLFEETGCDEDFLVFQNRFKNTLEILTSKLYKSKLQAKKIYPYKELWLNSKKQQIFLRDNIWHITDIKKGTFMLNWVEFNIDGFIERFSWLTNNVDRLEWESTLSHWDLNLANVITDSNSNIWIIDWTHAWEHLVELDFAKIENDIKYVMSKDFKEEDLHNLAMFERYLLENINLPELEQLPKDIQETLKDLRFKKIYLTLKELRKSYLETRTHKNDVLYKIALLRYSIHTLSFDKELWRWECNKTQLKYALIWTSYLMDLLENDDLHRFSPTQKAKNYPDRIKIPSEKVDWNEEFQEYFPLDYTNPEVLTKASADPEDPKDIDEDRLKKSIAWYEISLDVNWRPLNPYWRTWLSWRWDLYFWWENEAVDPVITRKNQYSWKIEVLLVKRRNTHLWELPWTFSKNNESVTESAVRWIKEKIWVEINLDWSVKIGTLLISDDRNTDNAWIESTCIHMHSENEVDTSLLPEISGTEYSEWIDIESNILNNLYANHSWAIKAALKNLVNNGAMSEFDKDGINELLLNM